MTINFPLHLDYVISNPPLVSIGSVKLKMLKLKRNLDLRDASVLVCLIRVMGRCFSANGLAKLKDTGRMAIIQNGSSLFTGDARSGPSEIRRYIIENDLA